MLFLTFTTVTVLVASQRLNQTEITMNSNVYVTRDKQMRLKAELEEKQQQIVQLIKNHQENKRLFAQKKALLLQKKNIITSLGNNVTRPKRDELIAQVKTETKELQTYVRELSQKEGALREMLKAHKARKKDIENMVLVQQSNRNGELILIINTKRPRDNENDDDIISKRRKLSNSVKPKTAIPAKKQTKDKQKDKANAKTRRKSKKFNKPGYVKSAEDYDKFKEKNDAGNDYIYKLSKGEEVTSGSKKWYWLRNYLKSKNSYLIMNDMQFMKGLLSGHIEDQIIQNLELFQKGKEIQNSEWHIKDSMLYSILQDLNQFMNKDRDNDKFICFGRMSGMEYLAFSELRRDPEFQRYVTEIDQLKINPQDQLTFIDLTKLAEAIETGYDIYSISLGFGVHGKKDNINKKNQDSINEKFKKLQELNLMKSEGWKLKLFLNHAQIFNGRYKVIMELIFYLEGEKIPVYYFVNIQSTSRDTL